MFLLQPTTQDFFDFLYLVATSGASTEFVGYGDNSSEWETVLCPWGACGSPFSLAVRGKKTTRVERAKSNGCVGINLVAVR